MRIHTHTHTHLVIAEAVMEKKQKPDSVATALASSVFPVPEQDIENNGVQWRED